MDRDTKYKKRLIIVSLGGWVKKHERLSEVHINVLIFVLATIFVTQRRRTQRIETSKSQLISLIIKSLHRHFGFKYDL